MALQLSKAEIGRLADKAKRMEARAGKIQAQAKAAAKTAIRSVEVAGAAFVGGAIQGYTYDPVKGTAGIELMGVPLDLALAGAGHLAAFTLLGDDDTSDHVHALSDGFLACASATYGRSSGKKLKEKMEAPGGLLGPSK